MKRDVKIGDLVQITSNCSTYGCEGVVQSVYAGGCVTVKLNTSNLPTSYATHNYSIKSLKILKTKEEQDLELYKPNEYSGKPIGVFFTGLASCDEFKNYGRMFPEDTCYIVSAHNKEQCMELYNKAIDEDEFYEDSYEYLLFDGVIYKIEPVHTVRIVENEE
ncbi:MAG: hypothetical protein R3230_00340 [Nitrosopumilaceae archaeon]|nr:hypothetical protein [Nitrosopumilaceae archaeon]